jgi:hypothetical protein
MHKPLRSFSCCSISVCPCVHWSRFARVARIKQDDERLILHVCGGNMVVILPRSCQRSNTDWWRLGLYDDAAVTNVPFGV